MMMLKAWQLVAGVDWVTFEGKTWMPTVNFKIAVRPDGSIETSALREQIEAAASAGWLVAMRPPS